MPDQRYDTVRDLVSHGLLDEAVGFLQSLGAARAADVFANLPFEHQEQVFRRLPVDLAAAVANRFPYYHAYVLLHSRPLNEMRAIVDHFDPIERMRFFDDLPEEAWQHLMDELSAPEAEAPLQPGVHPAVAPPIGAPPAALEPIIQAQGVEKSFQQPDGRHIQVNLSGSMCSIHNGKDPLPPCTRAYLRHRENGRRWAGDVADKYDLCPRSHSTPKRVDKGFGRIKRKRNRLVFISETIFL